MHSVCETKHWSIIFAVKFPLRHLGRKENREGGWERGVREGRGTQEGI